MGYIGIDESVADTRLNPDLFFDIQSDKSLKYQLKQPVPVIFDTDVGNDIDDVLAMQNAIQL